VEGIAVGVLIEDVQKSRARARARLVEAMATQRYTNVVENMKRTLREGDDSMGAAALPIRTFGAKMLGKRYKRVRRDGGELTEESAAAQFHAVRVTTKHLRYALEALEAVFPQRARRFINATKDVQDLLGEHQDASVAITRLHGIVDLAQSVEVPAAALFHTGELAERQRGRMRELRAAWPGTFEALKHAHKAFAKAMKDQ
jgi:CHAD domain-containing protein